MAEGNPDHPTARAIRAARHYSGMSRAQLAERISMKQGTIGRWERGEWKTEPPRPPMLQAIARHTRIYELVDALGGQAILPPDDDAGATRFADAARREAERQSGHPGSERGAPGAGDAGDAGQ